MQHNDIFEKALKGKGTGESVTASVVKTADRVGAKFIVSLTYSGYSARMISRYKPTQQIVVFTPNEQTFQKSTLSFGCSPVAIEKITDFNLILKEVRNYFLKNKFAQKGDKVVIAAGLPFGKVIETNMLLVEVL
jgi:pyruvate kinase